MPRSLWLAIVIAAAAAITLIVLLFLPPPPSPGIPLLGRIDHIPTPRPKR